jgi:CRISPR-associated endonuclease/helicase Cas3
MMVTFISQCEKKALKRTRRVLDAFANRIGDNTWQTVITEEGLKTVKKMLRQTASKSTAVSCHWIRSRSRSQFLWVVGNKSKFDDNGYVPVNSTQKQITQFENDWHYLPVIKALSALAAIFHDWGKATALFQEKLKASLVLGDPIRHEWISCLLLRAIVQTSDNQTDDTTWLSILSAGKINEKDLTDILKQVDQEPPIGLPQAAKLVLWLIMSHHRLPLPNDINNWRDEPASDLESVLKHISREWGYENRYNEEEYGRRLPGCFEFPNGLMSQSSRWMKQVKKWAKRLKDCLPIIEQSIKDGSYRIILHHARLCLMLGDHYHSSQDADKGWQDKTGLFANTGKGKVLKQKLDEHLVGVMKSALHTAHFLPKFEKDLPVAQGILSLKRPSPKAYHWQNKAVQEITSWRKRQNETTYGFFAVNMASTGCGKTFANAKIMRALSSDGDTLRYILSLGLRTLTLQTGNEYRNRIGLDDSELAVVIGSKAILELHDQGQKNENVIDEYAGSESLEPLLDEEVDYDCDIPEEGLATVFKRPRDRKLLYAPVLACTIDHLMAATETKRGGRHILPTLRLISSDLVIDEVDDFTGSDLIAIGRLIHLAGMFGRKVVISSATIPPDLAEGYLNAYCAGWQINCLSRSISNNIGCGWIDEFNTSVTSISKSQKHDAMEMYREHHQRFVTKRVKKLAAQPARRKADIVECQNIIDEYEFDSNETKQAQFCSKIQQAVLDKHASHFTLDRATGIHVSFGVIRLANISPCVAAAKFLMECDWPSHFDVKIMAYHSQQVMLLRHEQERHLDNVLKRKPPSSNEQQRIIDNPVIRKHLKQSSAKNMLFIVVATPVEELGRDHDFDWAVVEPSSYRSIIQLAGRVRRHREGAVASPNVGLLQYNWRAIEAGDQPGEKYFLNPGYEDKQVLDTHNLKELIDTNDIALSVNAIPRVLKPKNLNYRKSLAGLEHHVTQIQLANYGGRGPEKLQGYLSECWHLTSLPQALNPFRKGEPTTKAFLMYDQDDDRLVFIEKDRDGHPVDRQSILQIHTENIGNGCENRLWLKRNYRELLERYSTQLDISMKAVSLRYGELSFVYREGQEYDYSDQFGLTKI